MQSLKIKQVKSDVFKFIPFSLFIIIPGLELLLPPFLVIFPNSIPSQFMSDKARKEKFVQISERRDQAAMRLNQVLPNYFYALEKDDKIHS